MAARYANFRKSMEDPEKKIRQDQGQEGNQSYSSEEIPVGAVVDGFEAVRKRRGRDFKSVTTDIIHTICCDVDAL
jgi:hypothetical protein